ncbi:hypothetical protein [Actinoplanes regularis]|uniref:hypothetical protein n=1 Tax=Actinoplanes regularis TaxID=52697 RepID=UPI0024A41E2F|nr:hypothetical protein [Actinoplanes regularis]GLW30096.1 hypothetical protein Areg01_30360 [Actinoplanes regularis]
MRRVFSIEIRRSAALGSALILLVVGVALLYFVDESDWSGGWMQLVMTQRLYLALLWPLALAAGAWQGRRERQSNVTELFASTPRSRASRTVPTLGAMALTVVCGYLLMGVAGGVSLIGTAEYLPLPVLAVTAVGALSLIAAVWVGLAVGRLLPSLVTAPSLAVAGLGLLLIVPAATRPRGWLALVFSPIYEMNLPEEYATVPGRASAAQAVWMAALAVTAVMLFASGGRRIRVAALLPVVLGATLAISVMPHRNRLVVDAVDPVAKELVCAQDEPRVCVSRVHAGLLPELVPQAREALTVLARIPGAPTRVHEDNTTYVPFVPAPQSPDVVLLRVEPGRTGQVVRELVVAAFSAAPECEGGPRPADARAAGFWLLGTEPVALSQYEDAEVGPDAVRRWQELRGLPAPEAAARVAAIRKAAAGCTQ